MKIMVTLALCAATAFLAWPAQAADSHGRAEALEAVLESRNDDEAAARLSRVLSDPLKAAALLREPGVASARDRTTASVVLQAPDGRSTDLHLYFPSKYDGTTPLPCLLLLHGLGSSGREMIDLSKPILDRLNCIGIAPDAKPYKGMLPVVKHWWKHTEDGFPLQAVKWARRHLNVDHERIHVLGYSMGGFGAWNLALRYPDHFASAIPLAGGISQVEFVGATDTSTRSLMPNASLLRLMFAHGDADRVVPVNFDRESHADLLRLRVPHDYREIRGGSHILAEVTAAARNDFARAGFMTEFVDAMGAARRAEQGGSFGFIALETPAQARYVRINSASSAPCRVSASISGATVSIDAGNVKALSVLVDGIVIRTDRELTVHVNGHEAFKGIPKPSLESVVKSFRSWFDRGRIFVAEIPIEVPKPAEEGF